MRGAAVTWGRWREARGLGLRGMADMAAPVLSAERPPRREERFPRLLFRISYSGRGQARPKPPLSSIHRPPVASKYGLRPVSVAASASQAAACSRAGGPVCGGRSPSPAPGRRSRTRSRCRKSGGSTRCPSAGRSGPRRSSATAAAGCGAGGGLGSGCTAWLLVASGRKERS